MTGALPTLVVLCLLVGAAIAALWLDARQRLMDRQLAIALPTSVLAKETSIRRKEAASNWEFLYRLANYSPHIPYVFLRPHFVLLAGAFAAAVILYVNRLFEF